MVWKKKADIRGPRGFSLSDAKVNSGKLVVSRDDGFVFDAGYVLGPQGLPGTNAIENDAAVAAYIGTTGSSQTKAALLAASQQVYAQATRRAVITDVQFAGGADRTGQVPADDAIQAAWNAGYTTIEFPDGNYLITRKIDLTGAATYSDRSLIGSGREGDQATTLIWGGPAGGVAVGTAPLATTNPQKHYRGSIRDIAILYPNSLRATGSCGLYIARPTGGVFSQVKVFGSGDSNDATKYPIVAETSGVWFDGCENNGPFAAIGVTAGHHWDYGIQVSASHASLIACSSFYCRNGILINQDSINSGSGPAYNVNVVGSHSYYPIVSHIRVKQIKSGTVIGGFCEPDPAGATVSSLYMDSSFSSGTLMLQNLYRTRGTLLTHYGAGRVNVDNVQDNVRGAYTGNVSTGVAQEQNLVPSNIRQSIAYGDYTTVNPSSKKAVTGSTALLFPGARGGFRYEFTAMVTNDTAGSGYRAAVSRVTAAVAVDDSVSNSDLFGVQEVKAVGAPGVAERIVVKGFIDGQSGQSGFVPTITTVNGGRLVVTDRLLVVEAY